MIGPNQRLWLEALRSGEYRQGKMWLEDASGCLCCLGVASKLFGCSREAFLGEVIFEGEAKYAPQKVIESLALRNSKGDAASSGFPSLIAMNDRGYSFVTIAELVEANPRQYFTEAR